MSDQVIVSQARADQWQVAREVRLAALADTPDAFGETLAESAARAPEAWRDWLSRPDVVVLLAHLEVEGARRPAGMVVVAPRDDYDADTCGLYGVWVAPWARGEGVSDALLEVAIGRAVESGHRRMVLDVGDHNPSAIALYTRHGFAPTGRTGTLPPPRTHVTEHELARDLP